MPYPPLSHTWARLRAWLNKEYPELGDTLNWGIPSEDLAQIEMQFGFSLPAPVRESYLLADGQEPESSAGCSEGLFFGLQLLPLEDVLDEWRFWRDVDEDPNTGANARLRELMQSIPPGYVRKEYSLRGWIPLISDKAGNYLGVDMNPAESGSPGQVIVFGREFDTKVVLWKGDGPGGWGKWLASFVDDLENGDGFEMGQGDHAGSDESEDDLGYESYFYDGTGRGQGDGGGDGGPTSMRLNGEYRGWNILEAFAHRSLRKWHEQGLVPDTTVEEKAKVKHSGLLPPDVDLIVNNPLQYSEKLPLATFDYSATGHGSGAEVPIPVLTSVSEEIQTNTTADGVPIPTISVTKPPAPLPVDLPTEHDIVPVDPIYTRGDRERDLEAGEGMMMQEIEHKVEVATASRTPPPRTSPMLANSELTEDAVLVPLPDQGEPSSPRSSVEHVGDVDLLEHGHLSSGSSPEELIKGSESSEEEAPPDNTIRLIGGGGIQGKAEETTREVLPEVEEDNDLVEIQSIKSVTSIDSKKAKKVKPMKEKGSVTKILGGKRKKGSTSIASPAAS